MKILIADDNETNRKLMRVTLQAEGLETIEAADGLEALAMLESGPVDVIISDILMPNMDGYRFCQAIRRSERFEALPFIVYTSTYESSGDETLAMRFGADKFIRRPAPTTEILRAIREVADKRMARPAPVLLPPEELEVMKTYSVQLVRKLEEKNEELAQANTKILKMHQALLKRSEQLELSEEKFRSIFENSLDVFYRTDLQGNIQLISPAIQRYGYHSDALSGATIKDLYVNPADRDPMIKTLTEKGTVEDWEITLKRQDGEPFVASLSARLIIDFQRHPTGIEGILRDMTERKRLEAQLLQAQKLESIGRLAGGIAHDFNNLLTAILGFAEMAEAEISADTAAYSYLQTIQQAANRAADLTHQLLAFARRQVIEPRVIDLNNLLLDIGKIARPLLGETIELTMLPGRELWRVKVDPGQFGQVLVNLAVNARDAMPRGGKLTIETANVTMGEDYGDVHPNVPSGDYVRLAVSDTGIGMDETVQQHIFEPFFTTKGVGQGTGLGLATSHGIVKQSGGHIWLTSEPDKGTTFKIYLPRVSEAVTFSSPSKVRTMRGTETILLVEDEPMVRGVAMQALRAQGYTSLEAGSGREALALAQAHPGEVDLLLTDLVMPQMSGQELAERLQALQPDLKVLFISGYTEDAILHQGVLEPGIAFLPKPFTATVLTQKVREILDKSR